MDGHALLMDFFLVSGINVNILILYILIKSGDKDLSKKLLITCFFIFLAYILSFYSELHGIRWLEHLTFLFTKGGPYLLGPLLYFYITSLFSTLTISKKYGLYFLPFIVYFFVAILPFFISMVQQKWLFAYLINLNDYAIIDSLFGDVYLVVYLLLSLRLFSRFQIALKANYSSLEEKDLYWSRRMILSALVVLAVDMSTSFYEIFMGSADWISWSLMVLTMIIFEGYLGYYGIKQARVFIPTFLLKDKVLAVEKSEKTSSSSHLVNASTAEINDLKQQLQAVLIEKHPYLDDSLTLSTLAKMLPTTDKKLSALLNLHLNVSFYDLINQHRVAAVKVKLKAAEFEKYSLLGIALDSGFKSKTSFNRVFKKETGMSPSVFKQQQ